MLKCESPPFIHEAEALQLFCSRSPGIFAGAFGPLVCVTPHLSLPKNFLGNPIVCGEGWTNVSTNDPLRKASENYP